MKFFFYGTLKTNGTINKLINLKPSWYLGGLVIQGYVLKQYVSDSVPFLMESDNLDDCVNGEVWEIPDDEVELIDMIFKIEGTYYNPHNITEDITTFIRKEELPTEGLVKVTKSYNFQQYPYKEKPTDE